jgi:hypothetical protein
MDAYQYGLTVEPQLAMLLNGVQDVKRAMQGASGEQGVGLNQIVNLLKRPDLIPFCQSNAVLGPMMMQPDFPPIVEQLRQDPQAIMQHMSDQRVQMLLQELLRADNPDMLRKVCELQTAHLGGGGRGGARA